MTKSDGKKSSFISHALLICSLFAAMLLLAPVPVQAAGGRLVKTVKIYSKTGKKGSWKKTVGIKYTYNKKKDPLSIVRKGSNFSNKEKFSYTYKAGKKISMVSAGDSVPTTVTYNKKGQRIKSATEYSTNTYKYNKKGYIYKIISDTTGNTNYKYKYKANKQPKSLMTKGGFSMTTAFNKQGYATHFRSFNVGEAYSDCKYYTKKNGLVSYMISSEKYGSQTYYTKYVFTYYSSKKITKTRYRNMLNEVILGSGEFVGVFWY